MKYIILSLALFFVGCASNPYGNFTESDTSREVIAKDVLDQLNEMHPPAQTTLSLMHEIKPKDAFGTLLVDQMRTQGYAIQVFSKEIDQAGMPFGYTLDQIEDVYRVTIYINNQRLSRPYLIDGSGSVTPSGAWSLKE